MATAERKAFGDYVLSERRQRKWNQREFAARLGVPPATVSAWETGRSMPRYDSLSRVATAFGTTVSEVLRRAGLDRQSM